MENRVYRATTEERPGAARGGQGACCSLSRLPLPRLILKGAQLVLSLLAFISEEVVSQCTLCGGLYFFEFVSCSSFLLSLLILIVYCTSVYNRVDAEKVKSSDFYISLGTGLVFLLASIIFTATHDRTSAEHAAVVFGFLASIAFLVDVFLMFHEKRQAQSKNPEKRTGGTEVNVPLNVP
ncbi:PREDICTED: CKLF-like MARVEL transmembrane domain-containing protein 6 [Elephantulus edwardii]|uniref:CKLF-like MARVEL transmembrane domain-containing protein 6 n=1 Tax=Elephantulus edwardii TaxID=28737 RepID=UPI0003F083CA|nr:PREDICTED: CKLF-like MARVEL transmembrane domain-containing protein 6 [Elephantulus edwardii]